MMCLGDGVGRSMDFPTVCDTVHATNHTWSWQHYTVIQREKNLALISTILTTKKMQHANQKLINLVELSHVLGAVIMI